MASKLIWTNNATKDLENIKLYLEANWPHKVLLSFLDELLISYFLSNVFQRWEDNLRNLSIAEC
jgi:hypothetical protein